MSTFKIPYYTYYTCQVTLHKKISSLYICYTPEFSHSAIFRFLFFCSSHFPHCAFSTLRTFHIFTFSTLLIFHTPRLLHFALSKLRVFYLITWNFRDTLISIWFLMGWPMKTCYKQEHKLPVDLLGSITFVSSRWPQVRLHIVRIKSVKCLILSLVHSANSLASLPL